MPAQTCFKASTKSTPPEGGRTKGPPSRTQRGSSLVTSKAPKGSKRSSFSTSPRIIGQPEARAICAAAANSPPLCETFDTDE
eukprot:Skav233035  [mRNA]  locus=scaffold909:1041198:1046901:+ [translate_table: standard]